MKRVLTALVLFPLITYVVLWSPPWAVLAVTAIVALLCFYEYSGIAAAYQPGKPAPIGYLAGLLILVLPGDGHAILTVIAVALIALSLALRADDLRAGIARAAFLLLGVVYVFGCWRYAPLLGARNRYWLLYALVLNWIGDIGAYYVGRALGRHKLAPIVSPAKSWEGSAASLAASLIFGFFFLRWAIPEVPPAVVLALTAVANVAGQFGDLCESALKRGAGVKDSGTLLPGHGGWLDRVDSTLFTLPVVYLYVAGFGK
ncbi:MAG TPA: phosphatidate cytidylyltransferase [Bryobacteraceae bacterium]|jgi:phosphatidate cytidylyltransferase|nr:phosphatidate cytidylyltransferase [Bryobacteraceae bacterium]